MEHALFIYNTYGFKGGYKKEREEMKKNKQIGTSHDYQNFNL